uniref:Uncharacterized protein n=1 Tax=Cannabis sativa TaxID=3483 RepID=A0A803NIE8_CANSA
MDDMFYEKCYAARETRPRIGEPHVDLGEVLKLARLREVVCQANLIEELCAADYDVFVQHRRKFHEEPRVVDYDVLAQYRCKFLRWMDGQECIIRSHQAGLDHRNREASNLIRRFNQRTDRRGQDLIKDPLQGRFFDRSHADQPSSLGTMTYVPLRGGGQTLSQRSNSENNQIPTTSGMEGQPGISGSTTAPTINPMVSQPPLGVPMAGLIPPEVPMADETLLEVPMAS